MPIPQRQAALPAYLPSHTKATFADAAPGHKFLLYFRNWQAADADAFAPYKGKAKLLTQPAAGEPRRAANASLKAEFDGVLNEVCHLPLSSIAQIAAIRTRQQTLLAHYAHNGYRASTTSSAPFATGLGNEHPLENGFAFLTPYGLPYLAGSGVKGIVRRAMQTLCDDGEDGFTLETIDTLLGHEEVNQPADARRGVLDFWDVFPSPAGGKMAVEIMTPHFGKYYQGEEAPHDAGAPIPVSFLAVPAKSQFDFSVVCHASRLPPALQTQWRGLLERAFQHAFEWVGFGAKTSVGYGAMTPKTPLTSAQNGSSGSSGPSGPSTGQGAAASSATTVTWPSAVLTLNVGSGEIKASFGGQSTAALKGPAADQLRAALGEERATKLKKKQELKGVSVEIELQGNALHLKGISPA